VSVLICERPPRFRAAFPASSASFRQNPGLCVYSFVYSEPAPSTVDFEINPYSGRQPTSSHPPPNYHFARPAAIEKLAALAQEAP
jgi:hypothetical protein